MVYKLDIILANYKKTSFIILSQFQKAPSRRLGSQIGRPNRAKWTKHPKTGLLFISVNKNDKSQPLLLW